MRLSFCRRSIPVATPPTQRAERRRRAIDRPTASSRLLPRAGHAVAVGFYVRRTRRLAKSASDDSTRAAVAVMKASLVAAAARRGAAHSYWMSRRVPFPS